MSDSRPVDEVVAAVKAIVEKSRQLSFASVIKALSGYEVLPFDPNSSRDLAVLEKLKQAAQIAMESITREGIRRKRPNEVGNAIEAFVQDALSKVGYRAVVPVTARGRKVKAGYPDFRFRDEFDRMNYLECKMSADLTGATSLRSFYFSPSKSLKVTEDAIHFLISLEVRNDQDPEGVYRAFGWRVLSLDKFIVGLKFEFNADNRALYGADLILASSG